MHRLALLAALLIAALPAAAQDTCAGAIRTERFESRPAPDGRPQIFAIIRNDGARPFGYTAMRTPVPGLEGTTPFGPFMVRPGGTHHLPMGSPRPGATIPEPALRASLALSCRM